MFVASQNGRLDVVRELLTNGSSVNAANNIGATPLMQASWLGRVEVVRALLAAGADKRIISLHNGTSAASVAGTAATATPGSRAAILALLAAAP